MSRISLFLVLLSSLRAQTIGVVDTPLPVIAPSWSTSGQRIGFASPIAPDGSRNGALDGYSMTGAAPQKLTDQAFVSAISVSSDGGVLVYNIAHPFCVGSPCQTGEEIRIRDAGGDRAVTTDTAGCIHVACANCFYSCIGALHFSSDAKKILYSAKREQPFHTMNPDGSGLTTLAVPSGALAPSPQRVISNNGTVVFTDGSGVNLMNLDGSNIRRLFSGPASNAVISADGRLVLFESDRDVAQIWGMRTDAGAPIRIALGASPSLSADWTRVAFVRDGQVWIANSDGSRQQALTQFRFSVAADPVISDDGSRVLFTIGPSVEQTAAVYTVNADGSGLRAVFAPRSLNPGGIASAAFGARAATGSLISAFGTNLIPDGIAQASGFPLPLTLSGVSLLQNARALPLIAVTPWQINAQLPPDTPEGTLDFRARFGDGAVTPVTPARVDLLTPAAFSFQNSGYWQATAYHGNTAVAADRDHPAQAGEVIVIYATGLGPTVPPVAAGEPAPAIPPATATLRIDALVGNVAARVVFAGLAPGLAGVYQVNAVVPPGLTPGTYPLTLLAGGVSGGGLGMISVK